MLQSLKKDGFDVFRYMIDLSMDAFSQEISWDNGQVEELKTGTEEEQRKSATTVVVKRTD
jgi:hypothetical protein